MNDLQNLDIEYLGITEAAEYLRVSASTLRRWEKKGFLVPERTPTGIRRYTKAQLDAVIQAPEEATHPAHTVHHLDSTPELSEMATQKELDHISSEASVIDSNVSNFAPEQFVSVNNQTNAEQLEDVNTTQLVQDEEYVLPRHPHSFNQQSRLDEENLSRTEEEQPPKVVVKESVITQQDNYRAVSDSELDTIFSVDRETPIRENIHDLNEYDDDAAFVNADVHSSSYAYTPVETKTPKNTHSLFLFLGILLTVFVISIVSWLLFSYFSTSTPLLSPVVN